MPSRQMVAPKWLVYTLISLVLIGFSVIGRNLIDVNVAETGARVVQRWIGFDNDGLRMPVPPLAVKRMPLQRTFVDVVLKHATGPLLPIAAAPSIAASALTGDRVRSAPAQFAPRKGATDAIAAFLRKLDAFEDGMRLLRDANASASDAEVAAGVALLRAAAQRLATRPAVLEAARKVVARLLCARKTSVGTLVVAPPSAVAAASLTGQPGAAPSAFLTHALRYMGIAHSANAHAMPHLMFLAVDGEASRFFLRSRV